MLLLGLGNCIDLTYYLKCRWGLKLSILLAKTLNFISTLASACVHSHVAGKV